MRQQCRKENAQSQLAVYHCAVASHQEFALLLPLCALSIGVTMGFRHQADQLPLGPRGLRTGLEGFYHLLLLTPLPVLLDEAPFSHPL